MEVISCLGSLVQSCCWEGGALQTNVTGSVPAILGLPGSRVCALTVYTAQDPGCSIWSGPCVTCGSSFLVLHKCADLFGPEFYAFPGLSSSGSQELDECTLPGCGVTYPFGGPSLSFHPPLLGVPCVCSGELVSSHDPPSRSHPFRISGSLWLITGSLFAVW